jgi:hypothetical protein
MKKIASEDYQIALKIFDQKRENKPNLKLGPWLCERFLIGDKELARAINNDEAKQIFFNKHLDRGLTKRH